MKNIYIISIINFRFELCILLQMDDICKLLEYLLWINNSILLENKLTFSFEFYCDYNFNFNRISK